MGRLCQLLVDDLPCIILFMPGMNDTGLPRFNRPPVIETVLGVHFRPVRGLAAAHLGLFWQSLGRKDWPRARELGAIVPQIERFEVSPTAPQRFVLQEMERPEVRLRLDNADESKVVQIQPNLLLTHWVRQRNAVYPRYTHSTKPEFLRIWRQYRDFLEENGFSPPAPIQWEVTYNNRIPAGELWATPRDWPSLFEGVLIPAAIPDGAIESALAAYHYRLNDDRGRLHIDVRHTSANYNAPEALDVVLTARGAVGGELQSENGGPPPSVEQRIALGLDVGRRAIVRGFVAIASKKSLHHWGYQEAADEQSHL